MSLHPVTDVLEVGRDTEHDLRCVWMPNLRRSRTHALQQVKAHRANPLIAAKVAASVRPCSDILHSIPLDALAQELIHDRHAVGAALLLHSAAPKMDLRSSASSALAPAHYGANIAPQPRCGVPLLLCLDWASRKCDQGLFSQQLCRQYYKNRKQKHDCNLQLVKFVMKTKPQGIDNTKYLFHREFVPP